jgi:hypothetical protein
VDWWVEISLEFVLAEVPGSNPVDSALEGCHMEPYNFPMKLTRVTTQFVHVSTLPHHPMPTQLYGRATCHPCSGAMCHLDFLTFYQV